MSSIKYQTRKTYHKIGRKKKRNRRKSKSLRTFFSLRLSISGSLISLYGLPKIKFSVHFRHDIISIFLAVLILWNHNRNCRLPIFIGHKTPHRDSGACTNTLEDHYSRGGDWNVGGGVIWRPPVYREGSIPWVYTWLCDWLPWKQLGTPAAWFTHTCSLIFSYYVLNWYILISHLLYCLPTHLFVHIETIIERLIRNDVIC